MRKLDKPTARVIKNLVNMIDLRQRIWRYRVRDDRLFAEIRDNELIISFFEAVYRREIDKQPQKRGNRGFSFL